MLLVCWLIPAPASAQRSIPAQLLARAGRGPVRVLVRVAEPPLLPSDRASDGARRAHLRSVQARVQSSLSRASRSRHFDRLPWLQAEVTREDLLRLGHNPGVISIAEDLVMRPSLLESSVRVRAPALWSVGYTGHAWSVAILDSGVDSTHPFLGGRIAAQACYSSSVPEDGTTSLCAGGGTESLALNAGEPCRFNPVECAHGTHLAGIAAGSGVGGAGIARASNIISVQVYSRSDSRALCGASPVPCLVSYVSDQVRGLEHVRALAGVENIHRVASVNLSLSQGAFPSSCDTLDGMEAFKAAVDQLRDLGIATVAASGNEASSTTLGAPACVSGVISVGSTLDGADVLSSFTNRSPLLSLLAPGSEITSSIPGGAYFTASGTSMAAPHVAGAWALLKHLLPRASVVDVLAALRNTGALVRDGSASYPRINIEAAGLALIAGTLRPPDRPESPSVTLTGTRVTLQWQPPRGGNGATRYRVLAAAEDSATSPGAFDVGQTLAISADLPPRAAPYRVRVMALNPAGAGGVSVETTVLVPPPPPPPAPTGVTATISHGTVTLSWNGDAQAAAYVIEAGSAPGRADLAVFDTDSPLTSATIRKVPDGTYYVRIRGRNAAGAGFASSDIVVQVSPATLRPAS